MDETCKTAAACLARSMAGIRAGDAVAPDRISQMCAPYALSFNDAPPDTTVGVR